MAALIPPGYLAEKVRVLLNSILSTFGRNLPDASATVDPPSLAAGAVSTIATLSVTGANAGDYVKSSFSLDCQGIILTAWVSAANTVSYQFYNPTAGTINLASGTLRVRVEQH